MDWILPLYLTFFFGKPLVSAQLSCPITVRNSTTYNLQHCLLKGYDRTTAPTYKSLNDSEVTLWFGLKFLSMDNDKIAMYGPFNLNWLDERLAYDSDFYEGEEVVRLPAKSVWIPPFFDKSRPADYQFNIGYAPLLSFSDPAIDFALVDSTGHVDIYQMVTVIGRCEDADFSFYPFDVHNCSCYISALDPNLKYTYHAFDYDDTYKVYYDIVQDLTVTMHTSRSEIIFQLNIVFRRHSRMHIIMLHVPVLGYLLFNFVSLWLSHEHLMKMILPLASFCGSLYQIHAIGNLMAQSYGNGDLFTMMGDKPMHIVLLYRNLVLLSLLVLLANFLSSLLNMRRTILISFLMEHSETYAKSLTPSKSENTEEQIDYEDEEEPEDSTIHQIPPLSTNHFTAIPISTEDYMMTISDILIVTFIAYNFGYLTFLVVHR